MNPPRENPAQEKVWTVTEITSQIKQNLEGAFPFVTIKGEISNLRRYLPHIYFKLKDEGSVISAAVFGASRRLGAFKPEDGMEVLAYGRISVYPKRGDYQIIIDKMQPLGAGALEAEFFKLKERLQEEGLFDEAHKKEIPAFPEIIGVITSKEGAAVHDIMRTATRKYAGQKLLLRPSLVQGDAAAPDLVAALKQLGEMPGVDVIIIGRGGGSIEDLWAFNNEELARTIYRCPVPVISGVGHETDFTICDFVADYRAATPTAAAEKAAPDADELLNAIETIRGEMAYGLEKRISGSRLKLEKAIISPLRVQRLLDTNRLNISESMQAIHNGYINNERKMWTRLNENRRKVLLLHPRNKLSIKERELAKLFTALKDSFLERRFRASKYRLLDAAEKLAGLNPAPEVKLSRQKLDTCKKSLRMSVDASAKTLRSNLTGFGERLSASSPKNVLKRGYSITRDFETGIVIKSPAQAPEGLKLAVELAEGHIGAISSGEKK